jgi:hypothetical protein
MTRRFSIDSITSPPGEVSSGETAVTGEPFSDAELGQYFAPENILYSDAPTLEQQTLNKIYQYLSALYALTMYEAPHVLRSYSSNIIFGLPPGEFGVAHSNLQKILSELSKAASHPNAGDSFIKQKLQLVASALDYDRWKDEISKEALGEMEQAGGIAYIERIRATLVKLITLE